MQVYRILLIGFAVVLFCVSGVFAAGLKGDFTLDGDVDGVDLADFADNFGAAGNVCKENDNCFGSAIGEAGYCAKPVGKCLEAGKCDTRPNVCPDVYMPVCGCDGKTYGNSCEAGAVGISIDHDGKCVSRCINTNECSAGNICLKKDGDCEGVGQCVSSPIECPKLWEPVCGCDGKTYGNRCYAQQADINISYTGECRVECKDNTTCESNQLCAKQPEDCGGVGKCSELPTACIDVYDPVCGCDGETYGNSCYAEMAGVNVASKGPCVSKCSGNDDCGSKELFCKKLPASCGDGTIGECVSKPQVCPLYYSPVCGCDGKTYGNECEAAVEGVNLNYKGMCETVCKDSSNCFSDQFCLKEPGACDTVGGCEFRPETCTALGLVSAPVCGCDGQTYNNECEAAQKGTSIAYKGVCKRDASCDDGTELVCQTFAEVVCKESEIKAVQNGCYTCVNPKTCLPWGVAECGKEIKCPEGETCNSCGTSSCPACDDCIGVCE